MYVILLGVFTPLLLALALLLHRAIRQRAAVVAATREGWQIDPDVVRVDRDELLGRGGFGEVFRGKYLSSEVAVKVVRFRRSSAAPGAVAAPPGRPVAGSVAGAAWSRNEMTRGSSARASDESKRTHA